jgi:hypothetical protein
MAKRRKADVPLRRSCGAMAAHMALLERYPAFRSNQMRLESATASRRERAAVAPPAIVTIKTIVHVVYHTDEQNISLSQIKSQFTAMNKDFRAKNADRTSVPEPFRGLMTDSRLQFALTDVTRTQTSKSGFTHDESMKRAAAGGIAPREPNKFLNIWVCPLTGGLLGYAQFPGGPRSTDGVVIHYRAFGTTGTAREPFHKGRTATHEVGHYFNLRHIWGDTPDCSGSDMVADTPNCAGPNTGKPVWPVVTCNNGPNGDMFMNYMDYTDDDAMFMFTAQQVLRMRAALETTRRGLMP